MPYGASAAVYRTAQQGVLKMKYGYEGEVAVLREK
jgi:hypothetical protein